MFQSMVKQRLLVQGPQCQPDDDAHSGNATVNGDLPHIGALPERGDDSAGDRVLESWLGSFRRPVAYVADPSRKNDRVRQAAHDWRLRALRSNIKTLGRKREAPPRNLSKVLTGFSGKAFVDEPEIPSAALLSEGCRTAASYGLRCAGNAFLNGLGALDDALPEPKESAVTCKTDVGSIQAVGRERDAAFITAHLDGIGNGGERRLKLFLRDWRLCASGLI